MCKLHDIKKNICIYYTQGDSRYAFLNDFGANELHR